MNLLKNFCLYTLLALSSAQAASPAKNTKSPSKDAEKKESQDTYNFYFQKGSPANGAEQGKAEVEKPVVPVEIPKPRTYATFEGHLGVVTSPASSGVGLAIGGQMNASEAFGFQLHLFSMQDADEEKKHSFSIDGTDDKSTTTTSTGGSFALAYTPFVFRNSSKPVRISGLLGALAFNTVRQERHHIFSINGTEDKNISNTETHSMGFLGVSATVGLTDSIGFNGYGKIAADPKYSQVGIGIVWTP